MDILGVAMNENKIELKYIKDKDYFDTSIGGIYGGLNPNNFYVDSYLYKDSVPLADKGIITTNEKGTVLKETNEINLEYKFDRIVKGKINFDIPTAYSIAKWLISKVREFEKVTGSNIINNKEIVSLLDLKESDK